MNVTPENIIVNSCEYTPVYLIPSTSVTQTGSYIITQSNHDTQKPITDNLKTFYENSGNLESSLLSSPKPRILKKQGTNVVGNNLKLASFLLPKSESVNNVTVQTKQYIAPVNNVIVKPVVAAVSTVATSVENANTTPTMPRVEIDRKIVRVGTIPNTTRTHYARSVPKNKPKEKIDPNPTKHTSVQLIKLGETYHSLNQLSEEQMKIVNKALKIFSDTEKAPKEPAYDPVTNTKFIYKVVSPRDLTVVGRNKVMVKKKNEIKKHKLIMAEEPKTPETPVEPKVTRSGRTVKLPKQMRPGESPQKPKKKVGSVVNCFQCSAEFCSFYRLQRHYENYPTHIPARIHSNLFHCLLAIIKGGGEDDQANIFIQQLEQLIEKIKSLLPCLLKKIDGQEGNLCTINDDIGRLFGMNAGKYNLNMEALNCVKDKDGHCIHNPAPKNNQFNSDVSKPSQLWLSKHNEEIANNEAETEDCARINSVDKWPTVTKRIWKLKQQKQKMNAKKIRLASESEQHIELGMDDLVTFSKPNEDSAINISQIDAPLVPKEESVETKVQPVVEKSTVSNEDQSIHLKTHAQFRSTHFDIRSSPIKLPSALVRKFQLNPDKMTNFEVQILQPLALDSLLVNRESDSQAQSNSDLEELFRDNVELPKNTNIPNELNIDTSKDWTLSASNDSSHDSFMKSSILFDSTLTPEKNGLIEPSLMQVVEDKTNCLFEPSPKTRELIEANLLQPIDKTNGLIEHSLLYGKDKSDSLFGSGQTLLHMKDDANGFYEPSMHVKPKCNSLIGSSVMQLKNKNFESALSRVKERANNLFDSSLLRSSNKPNNSDPLIHNKEENSFFDTDMSHIKERQNNLFESSLMNIKNKDLLDPSLLLKDDNNSMLGQSLVHDDKSNSLIDQSLIDIKDEESVNIAVNPNESVSRLLSNQGQSVLNFLDSLGNESLGLTYPETEIRNSAVDFQLDLFSFNNS